MSVLLVRDFAIAKAETKPMLIFCIFFICKAICFFSALQVISENALEARLDTDQKQSINKYIEFDAHPLIIPERKWAPEQKQRHAARVSLCVNEPMNAPKNANETKVSKRGKRDGRSPSQ